jgi:aryl-alcohol dehydrogenase
LKVAGAVIREKSQPFTIEQLELDAPRPDEILVRIVGTGLCHTDLTIRNNSLMLPLVLGHVGAGVVEQVGERITKVKPGRSRGADLPVMRAMRKLPAGSSCLLCAVVWTDF